MRNTGRFMVMNLRSNGGDWYCPIGRTIDNSPVRIRKVNKAIMRARMASQR